MRKILNETNFSTSRKKILLCKPVVLYLFEIVAQSNKLAAHLSIKGDQNDICNMTVFLHTFSDILRLGGTYNKFNGNPVCRGTPVEKL